MLLAQKIMQQQTPHLLTEDAQAIIALCTPRGSGAIALIRLSGDNAVYVADSIARLSSGTTLTQAPTHTIHHGHVIDPANDNEVVDEVLFLLMRGPKTFTGQDTVEITCHNNQFIIERLINLAVAYGARPARPGEFSKRAYLQGKIDLVQAEAINELLSAQTELALRQSMSMLGGSLSQHVSHIQAQLVSLLGYVEASFEFLDEEQRDLDFNNAIIQRTASILKQVGELKAHFAHQKQVKEGIRIAVLGVVNAGKSTLFNALIKNERAIVTDIAGTTRDSIEAGIYSNGNFLLFIDTAGMRQTDDVIEQMGIERSFAQAAHADVILLVVDATSTLTTQQAEQYQALLNQYHTKIIVVINKIDVQAFDNPFVVSAHRGLADSGCIEPSQAPWQDVPVIKVCAKQSTGIEELQTAIEGKIQELFSQLNSPFLLNQRQFKLLTEIEARLEFIANGYADGIHYELVAYKVKDLLEKVSELTGRNVTEQVLDTVFSEFCVGK